TPVPEPRLGKGRAHFERRAPGRKLRLVDDDAFHGDDRAERHRAERAEHEQGAMREIDDAERPENEGQAERDERIGPALVQPVEQLSENRIHGCVAPDGPVCPAAEAAGHVSGRWPALRRTYWVRTAPARPRRSRDRRSPRRARWC